jgi:hypothetical protein
VPDGTNDYDIRTTLNLSASGGYYQSYLRVSADYSNYYGIMLADVTFTGSTCAANIEYTDRLPAQSHG